MNTFYADLDWADKQVKAPWWGDIYRNAWPDCIAWVPIDGKSRAQENGVDHLVMLGRDKTLRVEVKCRREDWPDVLLETHSCWERKTPGWVEKPLSADYFGYAFVPSRQCLLFPMLNLQAAWRQHKDEWTVWAEDGKAGFSLCYGKTQGNGGGQLYSTRNIAVPRNVLGAAVVNTMSVRW